MGKNWDALIIGSGMGGMACASALAKLGKRVLILEQHYVAGGFTHTFTRKGYDWDVGVHCIGEMGPQEIPGRILNWLSDGTIKMIPLGEIYETFHFPGGESYQFPNTWKDFKKSLLSWFPEEKAAIERYFALIREVSQKAKLFFAFRTLPEWLDHAGSKLLPGKNLWWKRTTREVLDELTPNQKLKTILTAQWGYYGATPSRSSFAIHALTVRHFWNGGYYPEQGASSIAKGLLSVVKGAGGDILLRSPVAQILVESGKAVGVKLENGEIFRAPLVISAAGAKLTAEKLIPETQKTKAWSSEIRSLQQSPAHICLHLGFEGDILQAGATRSNQWFFETWDMEDDYWHVEDPKSSASVLYMSFPSLKDPRHVPGPQMRHTGEVVTFVPWEAFTPWQDTRRGKRRPDYMEFKKSIEDRVTAQLQRHMPKLMELVKYQELSTPLSTIFFTRAPQGGIYGLEATPRRFLSPKIRTRTPIKNLYMAGGDVATLGVTGALIGGVLAAATIHPSIFRKLI